MANTDNPADVNINYQHISSEKNGFSMDVRLQDSFTQDSSIEGQADLTAGQVQLERTLPSILVSSAERENIEFDQNSFDDTANLLTETSPNCRSSEAGELLSDIGITTNSEVAISHPVMIAGKFDKIGDPINHGNVESTADCVYTIIGGDHDENEMQDKNLQGPHDWRKRLKPVKKGKEVPDNKYQTADIGGEEEDVNERISKERGDATDGHRIREKLRQLPIPRKESLEKKQRGPMIAKQGSSGSHLLVSSHCGPGPVIGLTKSRNFSTNVESVFTKAVVHKPASPSMYRKKPAGFQNPTRIPLPAVEKRAGAMGRRPPSPSMPATDSPAIAHSTKKRVEKVMKARLYLLQQMGPNSFLIGGDSPDHKYKVIIGPQRCSCGRSPNCVHILFIMLRVFQVKENDPQLWSKTLKNFEVETLFRFFRERRTQRLSDLRKRPKPQQRQALNNQQDADDGDENAPAGDSETKEEEETCPICLLEMVEGESLTECINSCQNKYHHHCISIWFEECNRQNEMLVCPLCRSEWKLDERSSTFVTGEDLPAVPPPTRTTSPQPSSIQLPHAEPILPEHMDKASEWIPVIGEEVVSCLFSKNWVVREVALKQLSRIAVGELLLGVGEGRTGVVVSPMRQATTQSTLECCCSILAFMCNDPVYKVFVAALRTLRTVLGYTPCRDESQRFRLHTLLQPVINRILWKCADGNKRTSLLSMSALQEFVKGQDGELAVGKEIVSPGEVGLEGVGYIVGCIVHEKIPDSSNWQWLLGRLYMLDKLLEEYHDDFVVKLVETNTTTDKFQPTDYSKYERVLSILSFLKPVLSHAHIKVGKLSRRILYMILKLQMHSHDLVRKLFELLKEVDVNILSYLRTKLRIVEERYQNNAAENEAQSDISVLSSLKVRCISPTNHTVPVTTHNYDHQLVVPPSSPLIKSKKNDLKDSDVESISEASTTATQGTTDSGTESIAESIVDSGLIPPPSTPQRPQKKLKPRHLEAACTDSQCVETVDACVATSPTLLIRGVDITNDVVQTNSPVVPTNQEFVEKSHNSHPCPSTSTPVKRPLALPHCSNDRDFDEYSQLPVQSNNSSSASILTDDLSDLIVSPGGDEKVSFKTEVTSHRLHLSQDNGSDDLCPCKEEVERAEAEALVDAMQRSEFRQDNLPHVPGLSNRDNNETLAIHVQVELSKTSEHSNQNEYAEGRQWVRGHMLGTGAFSTCYQARDVKTGTLMAVKQIAFCRNSLSEQEKVITAVRDEIEMMAKLNHPNIVRILGATQQGCHFFMFAEWMAGGSVAYLLDRYGAFVDSVITAYTQQILLGISYLHDSHILHRDLKGANLLVDSTGQRLRIGDFGASARLASRATGGGEFQGQLIGTIAFMAPEVLRGESYGRSCDIWSVGCCIIEMATTKPPWGASDLSNHLALIFKIASCTEAPPIPDSLLPPLKDLLRRCMECHREERPPARELLKHPLFTMWQ